MTDKQEIVVKQPMPWGKLLLAFLGGGLGAGVIAADRSAAPAAPQAVKVTVDVTGTVGCKLDRLPPLEVVPLVRKP